MQVRIGMQDAGVCWGFSEGSKKSVAEVSNKQKGWKQWHLSFTLYYVQQTDIYPSIHTVQFDKPALWGWKSSKDSMK